MTHSEQRQQGGGLFDFSNAQDAGGPLTREQFDATVERMRNLPPRAPHGTKDNPHIVHPRTLKRGYGHCVECGEPVGDWPEHLKNRIRAALHASVQPPSGGER